MESIVGFLFSRFTHPVDRTVHAKSNVRWFLLQSSPYARWYCYSFICLLGNATASLLVPLAMMWIIDAIIPAQDFHRLILAVWILFLASGGSFILGRAGGRCLFHLSQQLTLSLRMRLFQHINLLSADYHETTAVGKTMFVLGDSLEQLGNISTSLLAVCIKTGILFIGSLFMMFRLNVNLTLLILPLLPLFAVAIRHFGGNLREASESVQEESTNTNAFLQDHIGSVVEVQLLGSEKAQARKAFRVWSQMCRAAYGQKKAEFVFVISSTLIIVAATVGVFLYGGLEVIRRRLTIGGLIAFYALVERLFEPLHGTIEIGSRFQQASTLITLIRDFLDRTPTVVEKEHVRVLPKSSGDGEIRMDRVSFGYESGRKVIRDLNLIVAAHQKIALIGPNGSGKSTLAKLMTRLYDVKSGAILIDNIDIRSVSLTNLRAEVSYVPQRAALFDASMEENIKLGNPWASRREVEAAAELAELIPVVGKLRRGWAEPLRPRGSGLSGGERQRVAIARALLRKPRILILDESTSELDSGMEKRVFANLNRNFRETTLVFITHRLSSIKWVDCIIVIKDGELQAIGCHEDLYGKSVLYRMLLQDKGAAVASRKDYWLS